VLQTLLKDLLQHFHPRYHFRLRCLCHLCHLLRQELARPQLLMERFLRPERAPMELVHSKTPRLELVHLEPVRLRTLQQLLLAML
jgi:hypothetical protein